MENKLGLEINTIITLDNEEKYILLNQTVYGGIKYFLAMGVDAERNIIPNKVKIFAERIDNGSVYVEAVTDPDMIIVLTRILKSQM